MSPSTTDCTPLSTPPSTPKHLVLARSSSTSSTPSTPSYSPYTPYTPTLTRSLSGSSTSSFTSSQFNTSRPSSPFLSPPSQYESRHPSELIYRRLPDSPKPHYFYERPGFFIPKRSAPRAPGEKGTVKLREGENYGEEEE